MSDVSETREVRLLVNGREVVRNVAVRRLLADFLREDLGLTATRLACGATNTNCTCATRVRPSTTDAAPGTAAAATTDCEAGRPSRRDATVRCPGTSGIGPSTPTARTSAITPAIDAAARSANAGERQNGRATTDDTPPISASPPPPRTGGAEARIARITRSRASGVLATPSRSVLVILASSAPSISSPDIISRVPPRAARAVVRVPASPASSALISRRR